MSLCLLFPAGEEVFINAESSLRVNPSEELLRALEHVVGRDGVYLAVKKNPCANPVNSRNGNNAQRRFR